MNTLAAPWFAEFALITWRAVRKQHRPPLPSELLAIFVAFGTFSFIGESQPQIGNLLGWGMVVATALNVMPTVIAPNYDAANAGPVGSSSSPHPRPAVMPTAPDTVKFA